MFTPLSVLVIGRNKDVLTSVVELLAQQHSLTLATHVLGNGHENSLHNNGIMPDALVLAAGDDWQSSCQSLVDSLPPSRPPFVVVGPENDMEFLRAAMRAGAREVFSIPFDTDDFMSAISRIALEDRSRSGEPSAWVMAFMNAKGGSGASFLAASIAAVLADVKGDATLLVDLDFQFGSMPTYLNLATRNGLIKALELVDTLDDTALQGYIQTHESGLHLLAAAMDDIILPEDVSEQRVTKLLSVLDESYRNIVVDLPHRIDTATAAVLTQANKIVLVTQQTVAHLHDTKRLVMLLRDQLEISSDRLLLLINRYDKKAEVRLQDFSSVFAGLDIEEVPGDFRRVSESINLGVPLCLGSPRVPLARRLVELTEVLAGPSREVGIKREGIFRWLRR